MRYVVRTKCPFCGGYVSYGPYGQEYEWGRIAYAQWCKDHVLRPQQLCQEGIA